MAARYAFRRRYSRWPHLSAIPRRKCFAVGVGVGILAGLVASQAALNLAWAVFWLRF